MALTGLATGLGVTLAGAAPASAETIVVQNKNPTGLGSLRAAVQQANTGADHDTITFAPSITGVIEPSGGLEIKYDTTIDGPGANALEVTGTYADPTIFLPEFYGDVTIEGLTVTSAMSHAVQAREHGGVIRIENSSLTGHVTGNDGGAIYVYGANGLEVVGSTISGSTSDQSGGGLMAADVPVTIENSAFSDNEAGSDGGAIAMYETPNGLESRLTVRATEFTGNEGEDGGAIAVTSADGGATVQRSTISGNEAADRGGGLYFGYGGGLAVESSTFSGNQANVDGGGMFVYAPEAPFAVRNSTLTANQSNDDGGAIYWFNYYDEAGTVANSTVVGNQANDDAGGIARFGYDGTGPGFEGPDELVLTSTVLAANQASGTGSSLGVLSGAPSGAFRLDHTFVGSIDGAGTIVQTQPGTNKLNAGDPQLGPLAIHGGTTETMLPLPTSPLLDAGTPNGLTVDQRGSDRTADQPAPDAPGSSGADIGAAELEDSQFVGANVTAKGKQKQRGRRIAVTVVAASGEASPATATATGSVALGRKGEAQLKAARATVPARGSATMKLRPAKKSAARKIAGLLKKGKKPKAAIAVAIRDEAGNADETALKVTLVGKKKPKRK